MDNYFEDKKIVVTGGAGFLGRAIVKKLKQKGAKEIVVPRQNEHDLRELENCEKIVKDADIIIHCAAKVGGIGFNQQHPGELFYDNLIMSAQLMEEARKANVEKFVAIGTVCAYPKVVTTPFKEEDLWNGFPEETNAPYGLAKKMMLVQSKAYRDQYQFNAINLLPVNLYGPEDNFNPDSSHVIPALIKKFIDAKKEKKDIVQVWGTGKATREFLFIDDAAEAVVLATEHYHKSDPVNIGSAFEISIKDLAELIKKLTEFEGHIVWDESRPDGQPKRKLDTSKAEKEFSFRSQTPFHDGLQKTIEWYIQTNK